VTCAIGTSSIRAIILVWCGPQRGEASSFAISADGRRLTVAGLEQLFGIMTAENLLGLSPTGR